MLEIMFQILLMLLMALGMVIILWIIYAIYWAARFIAIRKEQRYREDEADINREYVKIEVRKERAQDELEILRADFRETLVKKDEAERDVKRKQELMKSYNDDIKEMKKWKALGAPKAENSSNPELEKKHEAEVILDEKIKNPNETSDELEKPKK